MKPFLLIIVLPFAMPCFCQDQDKVPTPPTDKSVEWVDIHVPKPSPLARQAGVDGTVAIEVRFNGCQLDPASPKVVSGPPMLAPTAMESLKQSTFMCGDFPDSNATVHYEFDFYRLPDCKLRSPRLEVAGSHIAVLATTPWWQP